MDEPLSKRRMAENEVFFRQYDERVVGRYNEIHRQHDRFVIGSGHVTPSIENIVSKEADFEVIEKDIPPPQTVDSLSDTSADRQT